MSAAGTYGARARDEILQILRDDFGSKLRGEFQLAANFLHALPREAENEVVNAVDHLTNALQLLAEAESLNDNPDERAVKEQNVEHNLWLARRHLALGCFYCIEHQIIETMQLILLSASKFAGGLEVRAKLQARADALEMKFRDFDEIPNTGTDDANGTKAAVEDINRKLAALSDIQADFMRLAWDMKAIDKPVVQAVK